VTQSQIQFLDQKFNELKTRLSRLKSEDRSLRETLDRETSRAGLLKDALTHEMSVLENLLKK
jgi:hypothetical protein